MRCGDIAAIQPILLGPATATVTDGCAAVTVTAELENGLGTVADTGTLSIPAGQSLMVASSNDALFGAYCRFSFAADPADVRGVIALEDLDGSNTRLLYPEPGQCDCRWPFLWEGDQQPPARWHGPGEGPVHYFADTPDGAWAELIRHEEIVDPTDLATVRRNLWAVEIPEPPLAQPALPLQTLTGSLRTYAACQAEAQRLRGQGEIGLLAPSAALRPGRARGFRVGRGLQPGGDRDGQVIVLFGRRPDLVGWLAAERAQPSPLLLDHVRHL